MILDFIRNDISIERHIEQLGFYKHEETDKGVWYRRMFCEYGYIHEVGIVYKKNGKHLIQSYEVSLNSDGFNNMVGLPYEELKWFLKKFKKLQRKWKKRISK